MNRDMKIEMLAEREVYSGRTITVLERDFDLGMGRVVTWEMLRRQDSVAIVPIDAGKNVYLVEQFHGAVNYWGLTLPKGSIENGDTPFEAGIRKAMTAEISEARTIAGLLLARDFIDRT